MSIYYNTPVNRVSGSGGMCEVNITAYNAVAGNSGVSLPCKEVFLQGAVSNTKMCYVSFTSTNVSRAICIPYMTATAALSAQGGFLPLRIPIDDVSKLFFLGLVDDETVEVMYRR